MKQTFKSKYGSHLVSDMIGTTVMTDGDGGTRWYLNLRDFRQVEVTDKTFHEVLDAKQEMAHAESP